MSDSLSQADIDRLLSGMPSDGDDGLPGSSKGRPTSLLDNQEVETLTELYNISMSVAANTLTSTLSNKASITYPQILDFANISEVLNTQENSTLVEIKYLSGLDSSVILLLKNHDVAIIADLMMGGTGIVDSVELNELQLSAAGEAMNQMMGSAATNLASILNRPIDISPPNISQITPGQPLPLLADDLKIAPIVGIVYKLTVGDLIDSELIQLMSVDAAKKQINMFMGSVDSLLQGPEPQLAKASGGSRMFGGAQPQQSNQNFDSGAFQQQPVTIQPARFTSFDGTSSLYGQENQNLELVLDVGLKLTVELGRAELPIKKVLELTRGSVIELDKVAGEPVDLLANGKLIAKGEVVVIEDNFGLRITSIISPADRLKNL